MQLVALIRDMLMLAEASVGSLVVCDLGPLEGGDIFASWYRQFGNDLVREL